MNIIYIRKKVKKFFKNLFYATGSNASSTLGDGHEIRYVSPQSLNSNWEKIATSGSTLAIDKNGNLWGWGPNSFGELGDGTFERKFERKLINSEGNWIDLAFGNGFSLALRSDGSIWTTGSNQFGGRGKTRTIEQLTPMQIGEDEWDYISTSKDEKGTNTSPGDFSAGIKSNGTLWSWGNNTNNRVGNGQSTAIHQNIPEQISSFSNWKMVANGQLTGYGIRENGELWAWGGNGFSQHGSGSATAVPVRIGNDSDWDKIFAGGLNAMAIKTNGTLWAWGSNNGSYGNGSTTTSSTPIQIGTDTDWNMISSAGSRTLAIKNNGTLWATGSNIVGALGNGNETIPTSAQNTTTFAQIGSDDDWVYVETHTIHSIGLKSDGTLWIWGLVLVNGILKQYLVPTLYFSETDGHDDWAWVTSSADHSFLGIKNDGTLWGWGLNFDGQLGVGDKLPRNLPEQIGEDDDWEIVRIGNHSLGKKTNGSIWAWGPNLYGQLGIETEPLFTNTWSKICISEECDEEWTKIATGSDHAMAIKSDNTLWGWGKNGKIFEMYSLPQLQEVIPENFLGNGQYTTISPPVKINNDTDWHIIQPSEYGNELIKTDNTLWSSGFVNGANSSSTPRYLTFQELENINSTETNDWIQIASTSPNASSFGGPNNPGMATTFAIREDGTLWAWGENTFSQMGDGTNISKFSPVQIGEDTWKHITTAGTKNFPITYGIKSDGTLWVWGTYVYFSRLSSRYPIQIGTDTDWDKVETGGDNSSFTASFITLLIKTDGTLWGRGTNASSALGVVTVAGATSVYYYPTKLSNDTNWEYAFPGVNFSLLKKTNGTIWTAGSNQSARTGRGTTSGTTTSFTQIGSVTTWDKISVGTDFGLATRTNGTLWSWGNNANGRTGRNTSTGTTNSPTQIGSVTTWSSVSAGSAHGVAKRTNGSLWAWGSNAQGELGDGTTTQRINPVQIGSATDWEYIHAGHGHTVATKTNGIIYAVGPAICVPIGGYFFDTLSNEISGNDWSDISVSSFPATFVGSTKHSLATKTNGTLWAWGYNNNGQLGDGTQIYRTSPVQIGSATDWQKIKVIPSNSYAIKTTGTLWGWGGNSNGQVGDGSTTQRLSPVQIGSATDWLSVFGNFAIKTNNSGWAWGSNNQSQLGTNIGRFEYDGFTNTIPDEEWIDVDGEGSFFAGIKTDGTLWAWGTNSSGELGDGTTTPRSLPVQIGSDTNWTSISTGSGFTMAIKSNGTLWAWGGNSSGQLGRGNTTTPQTSPIQVGSATDWKSVYAANSAFAGFTHAIKTNGQLWAWGNNTNGKLGRGNTTTPQTSPIQIGSATDWKLISNKLGQHVLAVKTNGTLWAWGLNTNGQLGRGNTTSPQTSPVQIGSATDWETVSTGSNHSLAIKTNGTLWAWGNNSSRQLGDGTTTERTSPVQIGTDDDWAFVSAANSSSFGIKKDGSLWGWGSPQSTPGRFGLPGCTPTSCPVIEQPTMIGNFKNWQKIIGTSSNYSGGILKK